jgi:tryptophan-rich hypothetical protein
MTTTSVTSSSQSLSKSGEPTLPSNVIHPKKLLGSSWTATLPKERDKHFIVIAVVKGAVAGQEDRSVRLRAVLSGRERFVGACELADITQWKHGWS